MDAHFQYPNTPEYNLDLEYPIDIPYLATGYYYIEIRAEDGSNFKNQYLKIFIEEIPSELESIIVLTHKDDQTLNVYKIEESNYVTPLFEVHGDYRSSALSARHKQLYIAGSQLTNLVSYDLETNENDWLLDPAPPFPMHAYDCLYYDQYLYCTFEYLWIYGYNNYGQVKFSNSISEAGTPSRPYKFKNLLLVDVQNPSPGQTYLGTYYAQTGSEKQRLQIDFRVVEFFEWDSEQVIIVAKHAGAGLIMLYDPYQNVITSLMGVPGTIVCAEKTESNKIVIGTDSQLYLFSYYPPVLNPVLPGETALRLRFDTLNHHLYLSGPDNIKKIIYPEMVYQNVSFFSDSILNFHLFYNK
ncbi:MAG: hypothetical protein R2764_04605 [Bacteroidales bacterium]